MDFGCNVQLRGTLLQASLPAALAYRLSGLDCRRWALECEGNLGLGFSPLFCCVSRHLVTRFLTGTEYVPLGTFPGHLNLHRTPKVSSGLAEATPRLQPQVPRASQPSFFAWVGFCADTTTPPPAGRRLGLRRATVGQVGAGQVPMTFSRRPGAGAQGDVPDKKPTTAYIMFVSDQYKTIAAKNPDKKGKEVMTLLGAEWKKLSDSQRVRSRCPACAELMRRTMRLLNAPSQPTCNSAGLCRVRWGCNCSFRACCPPPRGGWGSSRFSFTGCKSGLYTLQITAGCAQAARSTQ